MGFNSNEKEIASRLQGIIDTAIDGIITIDSQGIVESVNKSAAQQFLYREEEIIGNNIKMLMPEPYHSEHDGYVHNYVTTKKPKIIGIGREVVGKRKNGELFPFRLAVSEVILNDRIIFTGIIHDLTEVKEAEKQLLQLNEELEDKVRLRTNEIEEVVNQLLETNKKLEESQETLQNALHKEKELNELKSRFVSMASHEFRTPLSTILSSASLISKYTDEAQNDKRQKHILRIKSAVNNLTGILNDFLSLSKIEEGKVIVSHNEVNIQELCQGVYDDVKGLIKYNQSFKILEIDSALTISSDPRILKNILFNLASNAIKYTRENDEITCEIINDEKDISFVIRDTGLGIPLSEQKHLFDRFFRASNVENIQGTGLGLNIVKRYVNLLNGEISFESEEGKGTTFFVKIPKSNEENISH